MKCEQCAWMLGSDAPLPYCKKLQLQHALYCDRFYDIADLGRAKVSPKETDAQCTCGVDVCGGGVHSSWCDKVRK